MFGKNKLILVILVLLSYPKVRSQDNSKLHFSDYVVQFELESSINFKKNQLKSFVNSNQSKVIDKIDYNIVESDNYYLAYTEHIDNKLVINFNKTRLSELFKIIDIWLLYDFIEEPRAEVNNLFTEYIDHIVYGLNDNKKIKWPEVFFSLNEENLKKFNSEKTLISRKYVYNSIILFLMSHETAHFILPEDINSKLDWKLEIEADNFAFNIIEKTDNLTAYFFPIFMYIHSLNNISNNNTFSISHPNPELRILELLHKQFVNFNSFNDAINKFGSADLKKADYYSVFGKTILTLLDYFMLNNTFSKKYHEEKATNGEVFHQLLVGYRYWIGYARWEKDLTKAEYWLRIASENKNKDALLLYGMFLEFEQANIIEAHKIYHKAFDMGNKVAERYLDLIHILQEINKIDQLQNNVELYKKRIDYCIEECINKFNFETKECELALCKKHLHNMNAWLLSAKREIIYD